MLRNLLDRLLLALVQRSWTVAQRVTLSVRWRVEGQPLNVPLLAGIGSQNLAVHDKDRALYRIVRHILGRTPGAVVDVGCNIGHFMELCVLAERQRRYVGFDVSPDCCYYTGRFINANRLPAHSVFPFGLAGATAVHELAANGVFDVSASLSRKAHARDRFRMRRAVVTLAGDQILPELNLGGISLIKIDVEGLELEVLEGLEQTLARERPYVIFEVLQYARLDPQRGAHGDPEELARVRSYRRRSARALDEFFRGRDYVLYRLCRGGGLMPVDDLDPREASDAFEMDHVALPREKAAELLHGYTVHGSSAGKAAAA